MKVPSVEYNELAPYFVHWYNAAQTLSLQHGIFIEVLMDCTPNSSVLSTKVTRIYFKAMGHEFESLRDLKKGLRNKAFA